MSSIRRIEMDGAKLVLMPEAEYEQLRREAQRTALPPIPPADARGRRPAVEFATATMARDLIQLREAAGLTREALACRAGVRVSTIVKAESGHQWISDRSYQKLLTVLCPEEATVELR